MIIQTHRKGKKLRGKCNKGGAHVLSPFGFIKHNYPSDEGLIYRSTGRADGRSHVISIANVNGCISEMNH